MPSRRLLLTACAAVPLSLFLFPSLPARAQGPTAREGQTPEAFLRGIYTPYPDENFKGQPFWQTDRFFAPELARAIDADMRESKRRGEVPRLDGDPFVDAQDWDIEKLDISVKADGPKATGLVTFLNQGKPVEITLELVLTGVGWRIADIKAPSGRLSDLYKK